uniref:NADH dehydrogenase subunit 6 n=1 Tax=Cephalomalthinus imparicornis TaxID=3112884 RepID=UPI0030021814|nr:NADH dehydrogenase subunit 6 [Fissocantharis imparicornis]
MMMMLSFSIIFLSISPLFLSHPVSMGLNLLIQTILITMITGLMSLNFWISYLLFLIMVGGMLILFMYMTSIASNEKFYFSKYIIIIMMMMILTFLVIIMTKTSLTTYMIKSVDSKELMNFSMYEFSPNKYFMNNSKFILSMLIIYLFITLVAITNISSNNFGPLRQNL